ncbi:MAG: hypothetical protein ABI306_04275 [Caulobacteraceae bacterium]
MGVAVTELGSAHAAAGSTSLVVTTTADAPAGSFIVGAAGAASATALTGVADAAGNAYPLGTVFNSGTAQGRYFHAPVATDLPAGSAITFTFAATAGAKLAIATAVTGLAGVDVEGAPAGGTGTSFQIAAGALGWAGEIVFDAFILAGGGGDAIGEDGASTTDGSVSQGAQLHLAHRIAATPAAVTYTASGPTSRSWAGNYKTFKAAAASPFNRAAQFTYLEF